MVARVNALLRRSQRTFIDNDNKTIHSSGICLDVQSRNVYVDGNPVDLTPTEFSLLRIFMENPGVVFTRSELIRRGLGYDYSGMDRTLDSHIKNLRQKINDNPRQPLFIQTVYGIGYRFSKGD